MTAEEFVRLVRRDTTPAGRLDAVRRGLEAGIINQHLARKLLDFDRAPLRLVASNGEILEGA